MARKLRIEYPGGIYYVMSRGNYTLSVFRSDADRELFLSSLGEACEKTNWVVHGWCLMNDRFHLVVETPRGNLVAGMKWLIGTYTIRFNRRYDVSGHLFSGRYKALPVDGIEPGYFKTVCDYVHLNPARTKRITPRQKLSAFAWSSYPAYLKGRSERAPWLRVDRLLGAHGISKDSPDGRADFERKMEARRKMDDGAEFAPLNRGWFVGGQAFRKKLLSRLRYGPEHAGEEIREAEEEKARQMLKAELAKVGWRQGDLERRRKGDPGKIRIAVKLRQGTTMTIGWIAEALRMGTKAHASQLLYKLRKAMSGRGRRK